MASKCNEERVKIVRPTFKEELRAAYRQLRDSGKSPGAAKRHLLDMEIRLGDLLSWRAIERIVWDRDKKNNSESGVF